MSIIYQAKIRALVSFEYAPFLKSDLATLFSGFKGLNEHAVPARRNLSDHIIECSSLGGDGIQKFIRGSRLCFSKAIVAFPTWRCILKSKVARDVELAAA